MNITESIKFNKLQEENEKLKKELAEKDKEIESAESRIESAYEKILIEKDKEIKDLEKEWEKLVCEKYDLQQTQLYKEDFDIQYYCSYHGYWDQCVVESEEEPTEEELSKYIVNLQDNSKYDLLESKEDNDEKDKEIEKFKKQQLYKEDFVITYECRKCHTIYYTNECINKNCENRLEIFEIVLKDNSKYDKLPSKDVK